MSDDYTPIFTRQQSGLWYPISIDIETELMQPAYAITKDSAYIRGGVELRFGVEHPAEHAVKSIESQQYSLLNMERIGFYWDSDDAHIFQINATARMNEQEARELERLLYRVIERVKKEAGVVE